jgi:hypothetical protein
MEEFLLFLLIVYNVLLHLKDIPIPLVIQELSVSNLLFFIRGKLKLKNIKKMFRKVLNILFILAITKTLSYDSKLKFHWNSEWYIY